jgi:hypothetical protein
VVRTVNEIEETLPDEGEFPGVDLDEIETRRYAGGEFDAALASSRRRGRRRALFARWTRWTTCCRRPAGPRNLRHDAAGADPLLRDAAVARAALQRVLEAKQEAAHAAAPLLDGQAVPTHAQRAQNAIAASSCCSARIFRCCRAARSAHAAEFDASLAEQPQLTNGDPWRIHGWLTQLARVREARTGSSPDCRPTRR